MRSLRLLLVFIVLTSGVAVAAAPKETFVFYQRSYAHAIRSSEKVFDTVRDDLNSWLKENKVTLVFDEEGHNSDLGEIPVETLRRIGQTNGAEALLKIDVDRPLGHWIKVTVSCFAGSDAPTWSDTVENATSLSGARALRGTVEKLHKALEKRLGSECLAVEREVAP